MAFFMAKIRLPLPNAALVATAAIMLAVTSNINWSKDHWKTVIISDGKGYYAYLPAVFIYHDLNFGFFDTIERHRYYDPNNFYDYRSNGNGRVVDKYYCGTALALAPFFLAAHWYCISAGQPPDGYSRPYALAVTIAAIFYMLAGLLLLSRTLRTYAVPPWARAVVILTAAFGTNLFYYSFREPAMSHVYSFAFVALFVLAARNWFTGGRGRDILLAGLALGMICLIRPVNGLVLLSLPFLAGSSASVRDGIQRLLRDNRLYFAAGILLFLLLSAVQPVIYRVSTGHFFTDTYIGEHFDFARPHFADILFSYRKGLFLYTPVYLLSLAGLVPLWRQSRFAVGGWVLFFVVITWVFSSWWCWYYGGSFSSRVYVEFIPLFMILLGMALDSARTRMAKSAWILALFLLTALCQVQTYQYRYYRIHWSEMTKEKYWDEFLRIDRIIK